MVGLARALFEARMGTVHSSGWPRDFRYAAGRFAMIPDGEKLIGNYLREDARVEAAGARVVGKPPDDKTQPWIMLTQMNAQADPNTPDYLVTYHLQLDCYAGETGGQPEAKSLSRAAREALAELDGANQTLSDAIGGTAVVSRVGFTGMIRLPDDGFEPARERVILDSRVTLHGVG